MYDILKEKKNQGKKNLDETNKKNNLELNNLNDSSTYQYGSKMKICIMRNYLLKLKQLKKEKI